jgi:ABC-type protease/lipase transport system fused ATPase/permease subunit
MGKTVFMVLHQRSLLALADRVLAMADGRITTYGKIEINPAAQTGSTSDPPSESPSERPPQPSPEAPQAKTH